MLQRNNLKGAIDLADAIARREKRAAGVSDLDPRSDAFFRQFSLRPSVHVLNQRLLTPYQRALLVLDGTVTKFIEAWTMDALDIVCLGQERRALSADHVELAAAAGSEVLLRSVVLQGRYSGQFHAHAISLISVARLSEALRAALEIEGASIGRILGSNEMETRRELLWSGREYVADLPVEVADRWTGEFIVRTYRIHSEGAPLMLISERFPFPKNGAPAYD